MTTLNPPQENSSTRFQDFVQRLNGPLHEKALWTYGVIVVAHWLEHLVQAYQIYFLHWARPDSRGVLGLWFPILVSSEILHWSYAVVMLIGLVLLRPGFLGRARTWWNIALGIQAWHFFEHSLLQWQGITKSFFFGSPVATSILQIWVPRVELHLVYNALVTIPMIIGLYYHMYPPKNAPQHAFDCTCARR